MPSSDLKVDEDGCIPVSFEQLLRDTQDPFAKCRAFSPVIKAGPLYLVISGPTRSNCRRARA